MSKALSSNELLSSTDLPYRCILLFGPPGSGKGTLGKSLASIGGHVHLSSGDIFRGLAPESPAGKLYHSYAHRGHLVPDEATIEIWHYYVKGLIATNRYFPHKQFLLLDGVPRTSKQVTLLKPLVDIVHTIVLEIDNTEELFRRMRGRSAIEGRKDDAQEEILHTRLQVYQKETLSLLKHLPPERISLFNAAQRPLEVLRDVLIKLAPLLS